MRTVEKAVYKFNELSDSVKQRVISEWRQHDEFFDGGEIVDTMKAFVDQFPVELGDWELGGYRGKGICYTVPSFSEDYGTGEDCTIKGLRLWKYLINNRISVVRVAYGSKKFADLRNVGDECPLTGMCWDCDVLEPVVGFLKNPASFDGNWHDLVGECFSHLESAYERALEDWCSEERIIEDIEEAGDYEFYDDGSIY